MTALPVNLTAALTAAGLEGDEWGNLAGELRLFMEQQQTDLHNAHLLALNLSMEVDQMRAQLLAMPAAAPAGPAGVAPAQPRLSKIFSDPGSFDGTCGKKFKEWWTRVHGWIAENSAALPADKAIPVVLSHMVSGTAGDFACSHLNTLLRRTGPRTWPAFAELIEKHFQLTNEVDQNRAWIRDLKQKNHPMEAFL